ncbi:MAG: lysophospholipid acyltransferase family protein [Vicinamibacterales bacterium]
MYRWIGRFTKGSRLERVTRLAMAVPPPVAFCIVTMAGYAAFALARRTRQRVIRNMAALLPATSRPERWRLAARYFVQECLTIYEQGIEYRRGLLGRGTGGAGGRVSFEVEGLAHLDAALSKGKGAIVVAPHVGNYFYFYWWLSARHECLTVATMGSPEIRPLYLGFEELGLRGFDYDNDAPLAIVRQLRRLLRGNGVVFLMGDFARPGFPQGTLFGRPSGFPAGPVALALESGAPVVPLAGRRVNWRRHRMVFMPPLELAARYRPEERRLAQDAITRVMEATIRDAPDQWLYWFNVDERWRACTDPAATPERGSRSSVHTRTPQTSRSRSTRRPAERV